jgi:hypothetical protein
VGKASLIIYIEKCGSIVNAWRKFAHPAFVIVIPSNRSTDTSEKAYRAVSHRGLAKKSANPKNQGKRNITPHNDLLCLSGKR